MAELRDDIAAYEIMRADDLEARALGEWASSSTTRR